MHSNTMFTNPNYCVFLTINSITSILLSHILHTSITYIHEIIKYVEWVIATRTARHVVGEVLHVFYRFCRGGGSGRVGVELAGGKGITA
jgi:hypothetical protein